MAVRLKVTSPDGVRWKVKRRWFAWRRRLTLRDVFGLLPSGLGDDPISFTIAIPFLVFALLALVLSTLDLIVQLVVLPLVLLARLVRLASWPVDVAQAGKHSRTLRARGFAMAGRLRDNTAAEIRGGHLAVAS